MLTLDILTCYFLLSMKAVTKITMIKRLIVGHNTRLRLKNWDPDCLVEHDQEHAQNVLIDLMNQMSDLQYKLYADKGKALLIVLQGIDTSGKDSTIRHVMGAFNPQSCRALSFKTPDNEELSHDYLWRAHKNIPAKGEIAIFNRSYYEDVIEVSVHKMISKSTCHKRYKQINDFERYLVENDIQIVKLFLHISKDEQKKRLQKRLNDPTKQWKFSDNDILERRYWDRYIQAHENVLSKCSTKCAPWYIIPANAKWFRNFAVANIIVNILQSMNLRFPKPKTNLSNIIID
jgi:PPK2 family polyphosphate:nucleotide phosphotransferase